MMLNHYSQDSMYDIVDSHCHLDFKHYVNDLDDVIKRAHENKVKYLMSISVDLENFQKIKNITEKYENIWCTTGIHPNHVKFIKNFKIDKIYKELENNINNPKVIGLGETGLDKYRDDKYLDKQLESFEVHLKLSGDKNIPTIVHTRCAESETIQMLNSNVKKYNSKGLIHCFSSSKELAKVALDQDFFISISGIITFKNTSELREVVKYIPMQKLLVETDAPYLAPTPHRGERNEPSFIKHTVEQIAEIKNMEYNEVVKATTKNFFKLFTKIKV